MTPICGTRFSPKKMPDNLRLKNTSTVSSLGSTSSGKPYQWFYMKHQMFYSLKESALALTVWVLLVWMSFFTLLYPPKESSLDSPEGSLWFEWLSLPCLVPQRRVLSPRGPFGWVAIFTLYYGEKIFAPLRTIKNFPLIRRTDGRADGQIWRICLSVFFLGKNRRFFFFFFFKCL